MIRGSAARTKLRRKRRMTGRPSPAPRDRPAIDHPAVAYDVIFVELGHGQTRMIGNDFQLLADAKPPGELLRRYRADDPVFLRQRRNLQLRVTGDGPHGLRQPAMTGP